MIRNECYRFDEAPRAAQPLSNDRLAVWSGSQIWMLDGEERSVLAMDGRTSVWDLAHPPPSRLNFPIVVIDGDEQRMLAGDNGGIVYPGATNELLVHGWRELIRIDAARGTIGTVAHGSVPSERYAARIDDNFVVCSETSLARFTLDLREERRVDLGSTIHGILTVGSTLAVFLGGAVVVLDASLDEYGRIAVPGVRAESAITWDDRYVAAATVSGGVVGLDLGAIKVAWQQDRTIRADALVLGNDILYAFQSVIVDDEDDGGLIYALSARYGGHISLIDPAAPVAAVQALASGGIAFQHRAYGRRTAQNRIAMVWLDPRALGEPIALTDHTAPITSLYVVGDRVITCSEDGTLRIWSRPEIEVGRERANDAKDAAKREPAPQPIIDPVALKITEELLDDPCNPGALAVIADALQAAGDPRGELIAIQLAANRTEELLDRERVLMALFAIPLDPSHTCTWGVGFVRRLELFGLAMSTSKLPQFWKNPSLRLLSELRICNATATWISRLVEHVPRSIRHLELVNVDKPQSLIAELPRVRSLALAWTKEPDIKATFQWLSTALAGRKLARLDLRCSVPAAWREPLAQLADELVADFIPEPDGTYVRHRNKPEWGRGRVVRRFEDKIEIEFPVAGKRVFRADAAFLEPA